MSIKYKDELDQMGLSSQQASRILLRAAKISGMSDAVRWTEQGIEELSHYNIKLYEDVDGGPINFIAGAIAVLHNVNGPCYEEV